MPDVTITLRTIDESSKPVNKSKKEFESLFPAVEKAGKGLTEFASKNATLIAAVVGTGVALKKAYDEWQKYAQEVRDVALASGATATEASKLLQVLDDYQISASDVTAATRAMTKEGLVPTIDTLAQLSDEYLSITDAQERNEFVIKNLGRAGLQWVNVLNQGGDALRAQSKEVNKSLILNDEMIEKAEKQRLAMDALSDSWQGFKVQVGAAVGELILANKKQQDAVDAFRDLHPEIRFTSQSASALQKDVERLGNQLEKGAAMTDFYNAQLKNTGEVAQETSEDLANASERFESLLSLTEDIGKETQDYNKEQGELMQKQTDLKKQIDALIKQGWSPLSQKVKDLKKEYNDLGKESTELAKEHNQAMKQMQYDLIATKLASDGLTSAEYDLQIATGEALGLFDKKAADAARAMNKVTDAVQQGKIKASELDHALRLMGEGVYDIDVILNILSQYAGGPSGGPSGGGSGGENPVPVATGGWLGNNWSLVGDLPGGQLTPYSELVSPSGYVFDAKTSRKLLASGIVGMPESHAVANDDGGGVFSKSTPTFKPPKSKGSRAGGGGTGSVSAVSIGEVSESAAAAEQLIEEVRTGQVEMRQEVQRAVTSSVNAINNNIDRLIAAIVDDSPRAISKGVGFEIAKVVG